MKLRAKLSGLITAVLLVSLGGCGGMAVTGLLRTNVRLMAENEREKLEIAGRALEQVGTREDFEAMGELARDAYLKYQFDRCYPEGYVLLKSDTPIVNKTGYEILDPGGIGADYGIQRLGEEYLLLMREPLSYPDGFSVLAVKNVTGQWNGVRRQAIIFGACFLAAILGAAAVTFSLTGRMLGALGKLERAAGEISRGNLSTRVAVESDDEVGQVAKAFNQMSGQVEKQVEDLELLLGALAHEMKTPVTSIMGYADSLLRVKLSPGQQEKAAASIYAAGKRMEKMSSKLLSLVGLYENESVEMKELSASHLLSQAEEQIREFFSTRNVRFLWKCSPEIKISGDETLLVSLIANLAENGCKASPAGGTVWGEVVLTDHVELVIRDRGCGIPEKDLARVKEPFYMADKSRSRSQGGSGLGLALGERIAKLHGAELTIASEEGVGTEVTVSFPPRR